MQIILRFLLGAFLGIVLTGTSISRTLEVGKGEILNSAVSTIINSVSYFLSVMFIAREKYPEMLGSALGALLVSTVMAYKNRSINE